MDFYKKIKREAARFPTRMEDVAKWISKTFDDNIILHDRAGKALLNYGGAARPEIL